MITRGDALDNRRRAVHREQPGEQDRGLQLRARDRQLVVDRLQARTLDRHRRPALVRLDVRTHLPQRLVDPHRPRRERLVADEREPAVLAGEDPAQQAKHGAGVAAVDRAGGRDEATQAAPFDPNRPELRLVHLGAELAHGLERRVRIGGVAEVPELAFSVRDRRQQRAPLADSLHGRDGDVPDKGCRGLDPRHCSPSTGATTTP